MSVECQECQEEQKSLTDLFNKGKQVELSAKRKDVTKSEFLCIFKIEKLFYIAQAFLEAMDLQV